MLQLFQNIPGQKNVSRLPDVNVFDFIWESLWIMIRQTKPGMIFDPYYIISDGIRRNYIIHSFLFQYNVLYHIPGIVLFQYDELHCIQL